MVKCPDCKTEMQLIEKERYGDAYWKCPKCKIEVDDSDEKQEFLEDISWTSFQKIKTKRGHH